MPSRILTVPMNPEFLPEALLLLAGIIAVGVALRYLFTRRFRGALGIGAAGIACIALAITLGKSGRAHSPYWGAKPLNTDESKPPVLTPAANASVPSDSVMTIVLGHVVLRVAPAKRYELAVDGRQFLSLDSLPAGLLVSTTVEGENGVSFYIGQNTFMYTPAGFQPTRPDDHTLVVKNHGKDVFRLFYAQPRRIEITGQFDYSESEPVVAMPRKGIHWQGGGVPPGTTIDLTGQGRGKIDFLRSGMIQITPFRRGGPA